MAINKKVLVVDDDAISLMIYKTMLTKFGYTVDTAVNGIQALKKFNESYALVLMDYNMPSMNGIEATKAIRQLVTDKEVPIIGITAHVNVTVHKECINSGMNAVITKPIQLEDLNKLINNYLK